MSVHITAQDWARSRLSPLAKLQVALTECDGSDYERFQIAIQHKHIGLVKWFMQTFGSRLNNNTSLLYQDNCSALAFACRSSSPEIILMMLAIGDRPIISNDALPWLIQRICDAPQ